MVAPGGSFPIPAAWNSLDQAVYPPIAGANTGGSVSPSWLGRQVGDNDRLIHARQRRTQVQAFPCGADCAVPLPLVAGINGVDLGPWDLPWTYGATTVEWTILCMVEYDGGGGETMYARPYTVLGPEDMGWLLSSRPLTTGIMVGAVGPYAGGATLFPGKAYTVTGPASQAGRYGLALHSTVNTTGTHAGVATGIVTAADASGIQSFSAGGGAPGPFNALTAAGTRWAIRLTFGVAGPPYSKWFDIQSIADTDNAGGFVEDLVFFSTPADPTQVWNPRIPVLGWEAKRISMATLWSVTLRELPLLTSLRGSSF